MENAFHQWLVESLPKSPRTQVGIGDDAAVLDWLGKHECVVTSDMLADGVHFVLADVDAKRVGRKCLAVNLSDMAAMGAKPVAAVVSLMLPANSRPSLAQELVAGMLPLAAHFDTAIVGGDTNVWNAPDGRLVVSVTVFGTLTKRGPLLRSGAQNGDRLFVTGPLGGSLLGHHLDFTPRVEEALLLHKQLTIHAAMDISDGLALDASRLGEQSHCGIELHAASIPISAAAQKMEMSGSGKSALEHALGDGEDFELLLAIPLSQNDLPIDPRPPLSSAWREENGALDAGLIEVGRCVAERGLWLVGEDGSREILSPVGFEHGGK